MAYLVATLPPSYPQPFALSIAPASPRRSAGRGSRVTRGAHKKSLAGTLPGFCRFPERRTAFEGYADAFVSSSTAGRN